MLVKDSQIAGEFGIHQGMNLTVKVSLALSTMPRNALSPKINFQPISPDDSGFPLALAWRPSGSRLPGENHHHEREPTVRFWMRRQSGPSGSGHVDKAREDLDGSHALMECRNSHLSGVLDQHPVDAERQALTEARARGGLHVTETVDMGRDPRRARPSPEEIDASSCAKPATAG